MTIPLLRPHLQRPPRPSLVSWKPNGQSEHENLSGDLFDCGVRGSVPDADPTPAVRTLRVARHISRSTPHSSEGSAATGRDSHLRFDPHRSQRDYLSA